MTVLLTAHQARLLVDAVRRAGVGYRYDQTRVCGILIVDVEVPTFEVQIHIRPHGRTFLNGDDFSLMRFAQFLAGLQASVPGGVSKTLGSIELAINARRERV